MARSQQSQVRAREDPLLNDRSFLPGSEPPPPGERRQMMPPPGGGFAGGFAMPPPKNLPPAGGGFAGGFAMSPPKNPPHAVATTASGLGSIAAGLGSISNAPIANIASGLGSIAAGLGSISQPNSEPIFGAAGGMNFLIDMLQMPDVLVQKQVDAAPSMLSMKTLIESLSWDTDSVFKSRAAAAIAAACQQNKHNRSTVLKADGMKYLITMLEFPDACVQENAANALAILVKKRKGPGASTESVEEGHRSIDISEGALEGMGSGSSNLQSIDISEGALEGMGSGSSDLQSQQQRLGSVTLG
ncbi:hypothetical protein T484DRAFT_1837255 [Baffinella frigidus]|nr:hypothetical protein T484DRAFT_1837255 [Cryptophyta sp. CCMP2293]